MTDRRVDITKMYAHVYFDLAGQGKLGIAVYSVARIPGFAGKPSDLVQEHFPGYSSAHELFVETLSEGESEVQLSQEEIQQGRIFFYSRIADKVQDIALKGKAQAQDPDADVVVNLDDPNFWLSSVQDVDPEKREEIGQIMKEQEVDQVIGEPAAAYQEAAQELTKNPSKENKVSFVKARRALESGLQRLYMVVSRITNPSYGSKSFPKRTQPPTLIVSKDHNIAYYPGFRGSPYMSAVPKSPKSTHTHREEPGKHWHQILVPNVNTVVDPHSIEQVTFEVLDQITEVGARLFFKSIRKSPQATNEYGFADFEKAASAVTNKVTELLQKIDENDLKQGYQKTASPFVGTWIDLYTGLTYESLPSLLSAKESTMRNEQQDEEFAKAAEVLL